MYVNYMTLNVILKQYCWAYPEIKALYAFSMFHSSWMPLFVGTADSHKWYHH